MMVGEDLTHRLYMHMLNYVNKLIVSPTLSLLIQQNIRSAADKVHGHQHHNCIDFEKIVGKAHAKQRDVNNHEN